MGKDFAQQVIQKLSLLLNYTEEDKNISPIFYDTHGKRERRGILLLCLLLLSSILVFLIWAQVERSHNQYHSHIAEDAYSSQLDYEQNNIGFHVFVNSNDPNILPGFREHAAILDSIAIASINIKENPFKIIEDSRLLHLRTLVNILRPELDEYLYLDLKATDALLSWIELYNSNGPKNLNSFSQLIYEQGYEGLSIFIPWHQVSAKDAAILFSTLAVIHDNLDQKNLDLQLVLNDHQHNYWPELKKFSNNFVIKVNSLENTQPQEIRTLNRIQTNLSIIHANLDGIKPILSFPSGAYFSDKEITGAPLRQIPFAQLSTLISNSTQFKRVKGGVFQTEGELNGEKINIYIADAVTWLIYAQSLSEVQRSQWRGNAWFGLGYEAPLTWEVFKDSNSNAPIELLENDLHYSRALEIVGKGDLWELTTSPKAGSRNILFEDNQIAAQRVTSLPIQGIVNKQHISQGLTLTFDDGPHPKFTPKILNILKQYNIQAIFYITGERSLEYPNLVRRIQDEGHILANHTYSHNNPYFLSKDQFLAEVRTTDHIIKSIAPSGELSLFRPAYDSPSGYVNHKETLALESLQNENYTASLYSFDSLDWKVQSSRELIDNVIASINQSNEVQGQILLHDGITNSHLTVQALPKLISELRQQGFYIQTHSTAPEYQNTQSFKALPLIFWTSFTNLPLLTNLTLTTYMKLFILFSILTHLAIFILFLKSKRKKTLPNSDHEPGLSVLVPCFNEEAVIEKTINSILRSNYNHENLEIIIIDDGSKDATWQIIQNAFRFHSQIQMFRLKNGGKSKALNFGLSQCKYDLVACLDADTVLMPKSLKNMTRHFQNPQVGGVAGNIRVGNRRDFLTMYQQLEYSLGQCLHKQALQEINAVFVIPGATGVWRRKALLALGGFKYDTLAEDTDLTIRVIKSGWKVLFEAEGLAFTEAPETWSGLIKQRLRWQYGSLQVIFKNLDLVFNRKHSALGFFLLPMLLLENIFLATVPINIFFATATTLTLLSKFSQFTLSLPIIDATLTSVVLLGWVITLSASLTMHCLAISNEPKKRPWPLLLLLPLSIVYYRTALWGIQIAVIARAIRGRKEGWGNIQRTGNVQNSAIPVFDSTPIIKLPQIANPSVKAQRQPSDEVRKPHQSDYPPPSRTSRKDYN